MNDYFESVRLKPGVISRKNRRLSVNNKAILKLSNHPSRNRLLSLKSISAIFTAYENQA